MSVSISPDHSPSSAARRPKSTPSRPGTPPAADNPQHAGHPDPGEEPLGFLRLMIILVSSHIGVRSRSEREKDFRRANGLHVFIAGVIYFLLLVGVLVLLVNFISSR